MMISFIFSVIFIQSSSMEAVIPEYLRSGHRLRTRKYSTKGPNYLWHIDGYDKLFIYLFIYIQHILTFMAVGVRSDVGFGFCVHGAIDSSTRKILWLEVSGSNNDPGIITKYYLDYVRQIGGTSRVIRADRGTENGNIAVTQQFFRRLARDDFGGEKSFMYGRSRTNQRIEA